MPKYHAFHRLITRFLKSGDIHPALKKEEINTGRIPFTDQGVEKVKSFFTDHEKSHIREAVNELGLCFGTIWTILRKVLKWKAYRPHLVQTLSPANMESRLAACQFWCKFDESWFDKVNHHWPPY